MKPISLVEHFATKIEKFGGYPAESLAEDIIESIRLGSGKERVELNDYEFWALYDSILRVIKSTIEPIAKKTVRNWDAEAREDDEARKEGLDGRY